jgi:hypothetical protein
MVFWICLLYFRWVNFWRLPETVHTRRVQTPAHEKRVHLVRYAWLIAVLLLAGIGQLAVLIFGLTLLTFVSLMFLDET